MTMSLSRRRRNPVDPQVRAARLQAAIMTPGRFAGRKELEERAHRDPVALATLRQHLGFPNAAAELAEANDEQIQENLRSFGKAGGYYGGPAIAQLAERLASMPRAQRVTWCMTHSNSPDCRIDETTAHGRDVRQLAQLGAPHELAARWKKQQERAAARSGSEPRESEFALKKIAVKRLLEIVKGARLRKAKHDHDTHVQWVQPGREGASSTTAKVWEGKWQRTTSEHTWRVSRLLLTPEVRALNEDAPYGMVYLRTDLRVVQGRGTSLVEQRPSGARGAWK